MNIRKLRLELGITQEELCKDLMNRVVLNRIESGKSEPSIRQLLIIAERLATDVNSITKSTKEHQ